MPTTLNTFIPEYLEIDQVDPALPGDANLFTGADPADGVPGASVLKPGPGTGTYLDWNDLGEDLANHQILDPDVSGKDPSSFPRSNECVGTSSVLSKMDLVYAAAANNKEYGYFAVARANNNGDAGYYWLFTRLPPRLTPGESPCRASEARLVYDISGPDPATGATGDVLLSGHFHPSAGPLVTVYQATESRTGVDAVSAINYTSGLWALHPTGLAAAAVNTTDTAPGALGAAGVIALTDGGNLEPELVAEAAVPISIFTGGSTCGASYFASVITRSSGSGGTSPDLKDLVGPAIINFGSVDAQATLTPTCDPVVQFAAAATGPDGLPLEGAACTWTFDTGATAEGCAGSIALPLGSRSASVRVLDPVSTCEDTVTAAPVDVYSTPAVAAALTPTCSLTFGYLAEPSGGSGSYTLDWTFSGGGTTSPSSSSTAAGIVAVGTGAVSYTGHVVLTDQHQGLVCTAEASASTIPYAPLGVTLAAEASPGLCPASDAVVFLAQGYGGGGQYTYHWNDSGCSGAFCTVNPEDDVLCHEQSLSVTVDDVTSPICPMSAPATATYSKQTTITASPTP